MLQKIPKKFTSCGSGQMIHFNVIAAVRENVRGKKIAEITLMEINKTNEDDDCSCSWSFQ